MKRGGFILSSRMVMHIPYIIIFLIALVFLTVLVKSYSNQKIDYLEIEGKSLANGLKGCITNNGVFTLVNARKCSNEAELYYFGAEMILNGDKAYFNKIEYDNHDFCEAAFSSYYCGNEDYYDLLGNHLRINWMVRNAR
jgi:hypothetical protein